MGRRVAAVVGLALVVGALGACGPRGSVPTLAKVEGWAASTEDGVFGVLEIAYDRATAERLWAETVPEDLPERSGLPVAAGVYGDLADVDLDRSVVAVWSSGESGSCPGWIADVTLRDGTVVVRRAQQGDECTADFNPYRLVLVLPRSDVPREADLPAPVDVGGHVAIPSRARAYGAA